MSDGKFLKMYEEKTEPPEARTIVVLGVARGGTSLISGLLDLAGIDMGNAILANHEDPEFVFHSGDRRVFHGDRKQEALAKVSEIIAKRNAEKKVWGWKDPLALHYLGGVADKLRNPYVVLVVRNLVSVALSEFKRNKLAFSECAFLSKQQLTLVEYSLIYEMLAQTHFPTLIMEYEKVIKYPEEAVNELCAFIGQKPGEEVLQRMKRFIDGDKGYHRIR